MQFLKASFMFGLKIRIQKTLEIAKFLIMYVSRMNCDYDERLYEAFVIL